MLKFALDGSRGFSQRSLQLFLIAAGIILACLGNALAESSGDSDPTTEAVYAARSGIEPGTFDVQNPRHGLKAQIGNDVVNVLPLESVGTAWKLQLRVVGYGIPTAVQPVSRGAVHADGNRVELDRGALVEWYVNDARGLEQGFTLRRPPDRPMDDSVTGTTSSLVVVDVELTSMLRPILDGHGRWLDFARSGSPFAVLRYGGLLVNDATGRKLPARLELTTWVPRGTPALRITIDARDAAYPLHVDPLLTTPSWTSPDTEASRTTAWGDWDGDGDLDLAVGNAGQPNRVYRNDAGVLSSAWSSAESDATHSLAWGDWDGDGDLDLAVGNMDQPNRIYRNDLGVLSLAWSTEAADPTSSVAWGDVNQDGRLDLAVGNRGAVNHIYVSGDGTSTLEWSSPETDATTSVAWADWNGDGTPDLIVGNADQPNRIYRNDDGDLSLQWSSVEEDATTCVAVGDWDGDQDMDLIVGNFGQRNRVYRNTFNGPPVLAWSSSEQDDTLSVSLGDLEGDGDLDLAVGNDQEVNRVYEYTGTTYALTWSSDHTDRTAAIAWGDWNGDGNLELATANRDQPNRIAANIPGAFPASWEAPFPELTETVAWGDWDGDGDLDLMIGNDDEPNNGFIGGLVLLRNNGGAFTPIWSSTRRDFTRSVAWADWDGDGDLDLAVGNWSQKNVIYRNQGGTLVPVWESAEEDQTWQVAWGDWDNDGDLDLATVNWQQPNRIYENTGSNLELVWSFGGVGRSNSVAWGDWDGDRDLDLAVGNNSEANRVYENFGGRLELAWESEELDATTSVAWGDFDADGDLDLAAGNHSQSNRVYENVGRDLVPAWASEEQETTENVAWGDWDGDGDLDLAAGNEWEFIRLYVNDGGNLKVLQDAGEWDALLRSVAFADFDMDGDLDLAAGNRCPVVPNRVYENRRLSTSGLPQTPVRPVTVERPGTTHSAYFFSSAERLIDSPIDIPFTLVDRESDPAAKVVVEYSAIEGGRWYPATQAAGGSGTLDLAASPGGEAHVFKWDAAADGVCSDSVVFRFSVTSQVPDQVGGPIQQAGLSSVTPPFRVGGTTTQWYLDLDNDGFGDPATRLGTCRGEEPAGYVLQAGDCSDDDPAVFAGAEEVNDGHDNQCPGEPGFGQVDEIRGAIQFPDPGDTRRYCWAGQVGATDFHVVRSRTADFTSGCLHVVTANACAQDDVATLLPGEAFFYLVRAFEPHSGSFGVDSAGRPRSVPCLDETKPRATSDPG